LNLNAGSGEISKHARKIGGFFEIDLYLGNVPN